MAQDADSNGAAWPPRLSVDTEPVLRLFTGENFYSASDASLREAVLNAIDAIGRRKLVHTDLEPEIEVTFDQERRTVSVADNGDGMDRGDVANLFAKVGSTASKVVSGGGGYRAVGEFGIGALSYFLVCDSYDLQTLKANGEPLGLRFSVAMLDGKTQAEQLDAIRQQIGTTLILQVKSDEHFQLLRSKFSHWMRNVLGLRARLVPDDVELAQGGLTRRVRRIAVLTRPSWIEDADLGPPEDLDVWDKYDGVARIDVLYRGVFVERLEVPQLWGLEGAIHVDPKHFRPKLNREGFVGDKLKGEVTPFLRQIHPTVLKEAIHCVGDLLQGSSERWSQSKAISLWLSVPRTAEYADACAVWDAEFRGHKAFRLLGRETETEMSISDIVSLKADKLHVAPDSIDQSNAVLGQGIRVLRARGAVVVQGLRRDTGYLSLAPAISDSTTWLLLHTFRKELPEIIEVANIAAQLIRQDSLADVFSINPIVKLVRLGGKAAPFLAVGSDIWINVESKEGRAIVLEVCRRNEGHLGLWAACMMHAPSQGLDQIAALLRRKRGREQRLGLVRRQFLRSLVE